MHNESRNEYHHDHTYFLCLFLIVKNDLLHLVCTPNNENVGNLSISKLEFSFVVGEWPEVFLIHYFVNCASAHVAPMVRLTLNRVEILWGWLRYNFLTGIFSNILCKINKCSYFFLQVLTVILQWYVSW